MPENDLFRRSLDAGLAFTQMTRERADKFVKDLVKAGEVRREEAASRVEDLLERSRQNTEALVGLVRKEIDARLSQLNLVTSDDLAAMAARLGLPSRPAAKKATKAAKAPAKKAPAKKAPAKKTAAKKTTAPTTPPTGTPTL